MNLPYKSFPLWKRWLLRFHPQWELFRHDSRNCSTCKAEGVTGKPLYFRKRVKT